MEKVVAFVSLSSFHLLSLVFRLHIVHRATHICVHVQPVTPFFTRWWRSERKDSSSRAAAEAQRLAFEQWATVSLQAYFRGHVARSAVRGMAESADAIQARWRAVSGRTVAAHRKTSAVRVCEFVRGAVVAARYRKTRAAAVVLQARWRDTVVRARLATEAEIRAEIQTAREESSARTLQAFGRKMLKRAERQRAAGAAQEAGRKRKARLQEERSHVTARAAVATQSWWWMVTARTEGRRTGTRIGSFSGF